MSIQKDLSRKELQELKRKYIAHSVKLLAGDYKNKSYVVGDVTSTGYLILKDLYGLNSKKKSYNWKIHYSNTNLE
jgi:hypothetical protein